MQAFTLRPEFIAAVRAILPGVSVIPASEGVGRAEALRYRNEVVAFDVNSAPTPGEGKLWDAVQCVTAAGCASSAPRDSESRRHAYMLYDATVVVRKGEFMQSAAYLSFANCTGILLNSDRYAEAEWLDQLPGAVLSTWVSDFRPDVLPALLAGMDTLREVVPMPQYWKELSALRHTILRTILDIVG